jgi:hypothetical protein
LQDFKRYLKPELLQDEQELLQNKQLSVE